MIKRIISVLGALILFSVPVKAENISAEEFYMNQLEQSGAGELQDFLPDEARDFFVENGIDIKDSDWTSAIEPQNVFSHIWNFLKAGAKAPLAAGWVILSLVLICAAFAGMEIKGASATAVGYAVSLTAAATVTTPIFSVITAGISAIQGCAVFMTSFVPIFAAVVAAAGRAATSVSMSALLLGACQAVGFIADFVIMPLMGAYLAISISSGVSPVLQKTGVADGVKKIAYWIMSLMTTVFLGILSIQTAINASADTLSLKTAKFIIGSAVPIAGTALSEALTTVTSSMGMLKTTVGIYGVIACAVCFLPLLAELVLWRLVFGLTAAVSDLLAVPKISVILKSADTVVAVLIGIILLTAAMFIISLSVVISAGGT